MSPPRWNRRRIVLLAVAVLYCVLTIAVVVGSPLDALDRFVRDLSLDRRDFPLRRVANDYELLGQRGPTAIAAFLWTCWLSRRRRTLDPLVRLLTALALLNLSVGAVKIVTGRLGPFVTGHAHAVFDGGDIYPSGHVSNAVVVFGTLAALAARRRTATTVLAVWVAVSVAVGTVYLDFHWVTDVVGAWLAGALVLFAAPPATAWVETRLDRLRLRGGTRARRLRFAPRPEAAPSGQDRRWRRTTATSESGRATTRTTGRIHQLGTPVRETA